MPPYELTWRQLTAEELTHVYLNEMRRDFPAGELKPLSTILNGEAAGFGHTWGVFHGEKLAAYLVMVCPPGSAVSQLDYFAVVPDYRAARAGRTAAGAAACAGKRRPRHHDRVRMSGKGRG